MPESEVEGLEKSYYFNFEFCASTEADSTTIKDVCLCGPSSLNGYNIPERAFGSDSRVKELYEGRPIFFDHKPYDNGVEQLAGVITNARIKDGRAYGDIETADCFKGKDLLKIVRSEALKRSKLRLGMSHVARYRFNEDRTVVEEILEVRSVDVVLNPATTKNFTEQVTKELRMSSTEQSAVDVLSKQVETLTANLASLQESLDSTKSRLLESEAQVVTLTASLEAETAKVTAFEEAAALEEVRKTRKAELEAKVASGDLPTTLVTSEFSDTYCSIESEQQRATLLETLTKVKGPTSPTSHERKKSSGTNNENLSPREWAHQREAARKGKN